MPKDYAATHKTTSEILDDFLVRLEWANFQMTDAARRVRGGLWSFNE